VWIWREHLGAQRFGGLDERFADKGRRVRL